MRRALACAFTACLAASSSFAAPINYGDFAGSTVTYEQVTENTTSINDPDGLFGAPTLSGDSLDFDPQQFVAGTSNLGVDITAALLEFDVAANPGKFIENLSLTEAGTTALLAVTGATATTGVTSDIVLDIEEIDGAPVPGGSINVPLSMVFSPTGSFDVTSTNGGAWTGVAFVDLDQWLDDNSVAHVGGVTRLTVQLVNTLTATSSDGAETTITKQDADGVIITANIPEPTTAALLLAAVAAPMFARR